MTPRNAWKKPVNVFRDELRGLRTGRATPALVEHIRVEYYGSPTPLKAMATISTPDPQHLVIKPFDASVLKDVEKAIRSSDLGMAPNNDGKMIRLQVPTMSGEQRQKMVPAHQEIGRGGQGSLPQYPPRQQQTFRRRRERQDLTEDERDKGKEEVQALLKTMRKKIQDMADKKAKEITEQ